MSQAIKWESLLVIYFSTVFGVKGWIFSLSLLTYPHPLDCLAGRVVGRSEEALPSSNGSKSRPSDHCTGNNSSAVVNLEHLVTQFTRVTIISQWGQQHQGEKGQGLPMEQLSSPSLSPVPSGPSQSPEPCELMCWCWTILPGTWFLFSSG